MGRPRKRERHLPARVYLKHGAYFYVHPITHRWERIGASLSEMHRRYSEIAEAPGLSRMADLLLRYRLEIVPTKAARTQKDNSAELDLLTAALGHIPCRAFTVKHALSYRRERGKQSIFRANREMALLSHVCTMGVEWEALTANPCRGLRKYKEPKRQRYVTDRELAALRTVASPRLQIAIDLLLLTGQRPTDIRLLRWDQITDEGIHFRTRKTGKQLIIEHSPELDAVLARARALTPQIPRVYVLRTRKGTPYTAAAFAGAWQKLIARATAPGPNGAPPVLAEKFRMRDLRPKHGSDRPFDEAKAALGHNDARTTEQFYRRKPEKVRPLR